MSLPYISTKGYHSRVKKPLATAVGLATVMIMSVTLTQITRSDGAQYKLAYSPTEKPTELIGFDGRKQRYTYNANDELITVNDSDLRFIRLKRDSLGRIVAQSASQGLSQSESQNQQKKNKQRVLMPSQPKPLTNTTA